MTMCQKSWSFVPVENSLVFVGLSSRAPNIFRSPPWEIQRHQGRCPQYVFLDGAMTKTVPTCSASDGFFAGFSWHSAWWFGTFFIFPYIGNNHPNWLIFFRGVQTTNQHLFSGKYIHGDPLWDPWPDLFSWKICIPMVSLGFMRVFLMEKDGEMDRFFQGTSSFRRGTSIWI